MYSLSDPYRFLWDKDTYQIWTIAMPPQNIELKPKTGESSNGGKSEKFTVTKTNGDSDAPEPTKATIGKKRENTSSCFELKLIVILSDFFTYFFQSLHRTVDGDS